MSETQPFPPRRRIYLMRHGEVDYYRNGRPVPPEQAELNEAGRAQAEAAAAALAEVPFDRAVMTGLPRTRDTARIVLGRRDLPLEEIAALREIRSGHLSEMGLSPEEIRATFVESLTRRLTPESAFLGGEKFGAFRERILPAFKAILADHSWRTMLLVAHGATNRVLLGEILGAGLSNAAHIEQDAGCVNIIDLDNGGFGIVRLLNFTPYNAAKLGMDLTTMERYFLDIPGGRH